jgi:hypothetical protein
MKYFILTFFLLNSFQFAIAERFSSRIHSIDFGKKMEPHLVKFDNARVGYVNFSNEDLVSALETNRQGDQQVEVELDKNYNILSAQSIAITADDEFEIDSEEPQDIAPYRPSVLKDYNSALSILNKMRRDYNKDGQCFNRAHVWAYEEYKRSRLKSMKLFLFFTNRYIRNYRFHWWFHVTPMTYVGSTPRTLDRRYASGPHQTKTWTDIFIKSLRTCPTIKLFNTYANNQEREDCYLIPVSMFYVIPRDIEKRDLSGVEKEQFYEKEIDRAYRDAFTN